MAEGEIDNLTMEQYLALTRGNQALGVVKPKIGGNVNFEIKSQLMRELRKDSFSKNKNDDSNEHVERVLDIVSLFNIPRVSHDVVMLRVFPITLTGAAKIWKVNIFYNGLRTMNRQLLDSQGPIPGMTPAQALIAIQIMDDHSQKWHDGSSNRNIESSSNSEGIVAIVNKLENLGRDMKKLKENVHAIQVGCQNCEGRISNLEETLNNFIKESRIRQKESENIVWGIKKTYDQTFKTQASSIKKIENHLGRIAKIIQDRETGSLPSSTKTNPRGLANKLATKETTIKSSEKGPDNPTKSMESYDHFIPFPRRLKRKKEKEQFRKFFENLQQLSINIPFFEALEQMPKYAKFMKDLLARKGKTEETSKITLNERCSAVLLNKIPFKEKDHGNYPMCNREDRH
ncbi:hypothetical protein Tco_0668556 [Tanacetum coccineum]